MLCQVILWSTFVVYLHTKVLPSFVRTFVPTYAKVLPSFVRTYVHTFHRSSTYIRTKVFFIYLKYEGTENTKVDYEGTKVDTNEGTKVRRYEGMFFVMTACERMKPDQPLLRGIYLRRRQSWPMYRWDFDEYVVKPDCNSLDVVHTVFYLRNTCMSWTSSDE